MMHNDTDLVELTAVRVLKDRNALAVEYENKVVSVVDVADWMADWGRRWVRRQKTHRWRRAGRRP